MCGPQHVDTNGANENISTDGRGEVCVICPYIMVALLWEGCLYVCIGLWLGGECKSSFPCLTKMRIYIPPPHFQFSGILNKNFEVFWLRGGCKSSFPSRTKMRIYIPPPRLWLPFCGMWKNNVKTVQFIYEKCKTNTILKKKRKKWGVQQINKGNC